jgi:precorrin-8X/cobalt-precorrin-8 methylmutase
LAINEKENFFMELERILPADIEKRSMEIIESELGSTEWLSEKERIVVKRVIHTTADFDYAKTLKFSPNAIESALETLRGGAVIVTDTNMAKSGINKTAINKLGCQVCCYMADSDVSQVAKNKGITRAIASMDKAVELFKDKPLIFAIGNAPTALVRLYELIQQGAVRPKLVIGTPVGFVNVVQSKELIMQTDIPYIVAEGRKGGSTVVASICNALLYQVYDRSTDSVKE